MRIRSITVSASNETEYLRKLVEAENNYLNEISLSSIGFISLDDNDIDGDDYGLLSSNTNNKIMRYDNEKNKKKRKKRKLSLQFPLFRKKLHKRKRGSTATNTTINSNQNEK